VELTEADQARLIALAVVATGVALWIASNVSDRRLQARFAALAKGLGSAVARERWLNNFVRRAIAHFYTLELPLDPLSIEEGKLVHRASLSLRKLDVAALRELLLRQEALAAMLERAL
jgi:hypothetical protein